MNKNKNQAGLIFIFFYCANLICILQFLFVSNNILFVHHLLFLNILAFTIYFCTENLANLCVLYYIYTVTFNMHNLQVQMIFVMFVIMTFYGRFLSVTPPFRSTPIYCTIRNRQHLNKPHQYFLSTIGIPNTLTATGCNVPNTSHNANFI